MRMTIKELTQDSRKVDLKAKVISKTETRDAKSRYSNEAFKVASATLEDETGQVSLTLWNEQIDMVKIGDNIEVVNGYVKTFRDELQLNSGKYGSLNVI